MKRVLVVCYSQSGQLTRIARSILAPLQCADLSITRLELKPERPYPFPWTVREFFEVFPESVEEAPCALLPLGLDAAHKFDLVVLFYQVWFLSPSIPVSSFLQSCEGRRLLQDTPVVTVTGCRNMWLTAQQKVERRLTDAGARLVGHVALVDRAPNLVSIVTTLSWLLSGRQDVLARLLPRPGVSEADIENARRFGEILAARLCEEEPMLGPVFEQEEAATAPRLMRLERRGARLFGPWARFVRRKGEPGNPERTLRLGLFLLFLVAAIVLLSPLTFLAHRARLLFRRPFSRARVCIHNLDPEGGNAP